MLVSKEAFKSKNYSKSDHSKFQLNATEQSNLLAVLIKTLNKTSEKIFKILMES